MGRATEMMHTDTGLLHGKMRGCAPLHVVEMVKEKHEVNFAQTTLVTAPLMADSVVMSIACAATPERPEMPPREPILKPYHVNHMMNAPSAIIARAAGRAALKTIMSLSCSARMRTVPPTPHTSDDVSHITRSVQCCEDTKKMSVRSEHNTVSVASPLNHAQEGTTYALKSAAMHSHQHLLAMFSKA